MAFFSSIASTKRPMICLLTEPYVTTEDKLSPALTGIQSIHGRQRSPRAIIVATKSIHLWQIPRFCNRDMAVAMWETGDPKMPQMVIACIYMPYEEAILENMTLRDLIRYCNNRMLPMVLSGDTNAHRGCMGMPY